MKLLNHPVHGFKHATETEAIADMANGWIDFEASSQVVDAVVAPVQAIDRLRGNTELKTKNKA